MPGFRIAGPGQSTIGTTPRNNQELHRNHRWLVEDIGVPSSVTLSTRTVDRFFAKSVQLPSLVFDEEKLKTGSSIDYKIAKSAGWQDFTIKFYDVYGLYEIYKQWQDAIWTPEEGIKPPAEYKGQPIISLTGAKGETIQTYIAFGAYPKSVTHGELSYEDSNVKLLSVVYSYDYARTTFNTPAEF